MLFSSVALKTQELGLCVYRTHMSQKIVSKVDHMKYSVPTSSTKGPPPTFALPALPWSLVDTCSSTATWRRMCGLGWMSLSQLGASPPRISIQYPLCLTPLDKWGLRRSYGLSGSLAMISSSMAAALKCHHRRGPLPWCLVPVTT
jgi:hypothetical protein